MTDNADDEEVITGGDDGEFGGFIDQTEKDDDTDTGTDTTGDSS